MWSEATGFSLPVAREVVNTSQTRTAPIASGVIAARQRVADFFHAARVRLEQRVVAAGFDTSFNGAVFAAF